MHVIGHSSGLLRHASPGLGEFLQDRHAVLHAMVPQGNGWRFLALKAIWQFKLRCVDDIGSLSIDTRWSAESGKKFLVLLPLPGRGLWVASSPGVRKKRSPWLSSLRSS